MSIRYPHLFRALKRVGHSTVEALQILWDAKRGCRLALNLVWITARIRWA